MTYSDTERFRPGLDLLRDVQQRLSGLVPGHINSANGPHTVRQTLTASPETRPAQYALRPRWQRLLKRAEAAGFSENYWSKKADYARGCAAVISASGPRSAMLDIAADCQRLANEADREGIPKDAPQGQNDNLRNWKERNQGLMPKADPRSKIPTKDRDFASPEESTDTCGAVTGEPGARGADANGTHGGTGSATDERRR